MMMHGTGNNMGNGENSEWQKGFFSNINDFANTIPADNANKENKLMDVISNERLEHLLSVSPAERVTPEYMKSRITGTKFTRLTDTVTHARITLDNGYGVSGESACVNVENYNQEIGEKIAYDNAFHQLWPLFGFFLAESNKIRRMIKDSELLASNPPSKNEEVA